MNDPHDSEERHNTMEGAREPVATGDELAALDRHVKKKRPGKSKVKELGIFTVGIGILLAILTLWLSLMLQPAPGQPRSAALVAVPVAISVIYIVLGALTLRFKSRAIIQVTIGLVVLGFLLDLLIGFNVVKAVISGLIIALIVKTGREALDEVSQEAV